MNRTNYILKLVAETVYEEEGLFFVTVNADDLKLPLEGVQRLVLGGKATPDLEIKDEGLESSLSINRVHYDVHIPWENVIAVEGTNKAFYCRRRLPASRGGSDGGKTARGVRHLRVVK